MNLRRFYIIASLIMVLAMVLSACAPAAAPTGSDSDDSGAAASEDSDGSGETDEGGEEGDEKVLNILYWQASSLPGPYLSGGTKDQDSGAITLEPLASYNPDGEMIPKLVTEIPSVDNGGVSEDLTTITWTLKEGVKWSDGSDFTAADVVFTWEYCTDEATGCTSMG